jgi:hypothetical protein
MLKLAREAQLAVQQQQQRMVQLAAVAGAAAEVRSRDL